MAQFLQSRANARPFADKPVGVSRGEDAPPEVCMCEPPSIGGIRK